MPEEWVDLDYEVHGGTFPPKDYKIRKRTLNDICGDWLEDMGLLTPKQYNHIKRAMALAIFEQTVLEALQSPEVSTT